MSCVVLFTVVLGLAVLVASLSRGSNTLGKWSVLTFTWVENPECHVLVFSPLHDSPSHVTRQLPGPLLILSFYSPNLLLLKQILI